MIDNATSQRLQELLGAHAKVDHLSCIAIGDDPAKSLILVTMKTPQDAVRLQLTYGFNSFGFNSVIINEAWIRQHLPDADTSPGK